MPKPRYRQISLKWRLILLLTVLVLFSTCISSIFYIQFYSKSAYRQFDEMAEQSLSAAARSIEDKLKTLNTYSKIILSNKGVQSYLKSNVKYPKLSYLNSSNRFLKEFITSFSEINSVHLIDLKGTSTSVDQLNDSTTQGTLKVNGKNLAQWFTRVSQLKGGALLSAESALIFEHAPPQPLITLLRLVNDLDTQKPIGTLALSFDANVISRAIEPLDMGENTTMLLMDERGHQILTTDMAPEVLAGVRQRVLDAPNTTRWTQAHGLHIREASVRIEGTSWYLVSHTELNTKAILKGDLVVLMLGAITFNGTLILLGAIWIARSITGPVAQMAKDMALVQEGQLKATEFSSRIPEMNQLKSVYNQMIQQISKLLAQVVHEERTKRRAELSALQAQIKPHFLYNTFDAISALALMGDTKAVYETLGALGQFYKLSLSSGLEVIPLKEELAIITHYLTIQQTRYRDIFDFELEAAADLENIPVLKLMLQPLVENALYHGLKPLARKGKIRVVAEMDIAAFDTAQLCPLEHPQILRISVIDDGVGMSPHQLRTLSNFVPGSHFGFAGTRERLRLYYGQEVVTISSEPGQGTTIQLTLPLNPTPGGAYDTAFNTATDTAH